MTSWLAEFGGVASLTPAALLGIVLMMMFTGRLVTLREHKEMRADRDEWRKVAEDRGDMIRELLDQNSALIDAGLTTQQVLKAIPPVGG